MNEQTCPECGMEKSTWPNKNGVAKDGKTYCCRGCAEGSGCTCEQSSGTSQGSRKQTPTKQT